MDQNTRKSKLETSLRKAMALSTLASSSEYVNYLLPYLKELSHNQPIDSTLYKTDEEYMFALKNANMRASVYKELITFLSQQEEMVKKISAKIKEPEKSYGI